jgi:AcrR family transcriptional regulator
MPRHSDARKHAIETAERLFRAQGYAATGLTQILEESGAPKGSFYFHFPGGKEQMALEALRAYGERIEQGTEALRAQFEGDPAGFVEALCRHTAAEMKASNWTRGCLAQNLANELAPADTVIVDAIDAVFRSWTNVIAHSLRSGGIGRAEADRLARALLAGLEGARTLARTAKSTAPFDAVAFVFVAALKAKR